MSATPRNDGTEGDASEPPVPRRRRVGDALGWWVGITLTGILWLAALAIWYIIRRGHRVRERLGPPREILWPDLTPVVRSPAPYDNASE